VDDDPEPAVTGQTTAFEALPEVATPAVRWTCTRCGNDDRRRVWADPSRPSLDARYALGWCDNCAPARKGVRGVTREAVALIASELFDRTAFLAAEKQRAEQKLLTRYRRGHALTKDEIAQVKAIIARLDGR
jgi:hypothetical protein